MRLRSRRTVVAVVAAALAVGYPVFGPGGEPPARAAVATTAATTQTGEQVDAQRGPVGWETYRHPERLAEIGGDGRTKQFSSFDRTEGNNDGFQGTYSCLRETGEGCLIAEHVGAGEIASIWFTRDGGNVTRTGRIRIELDGKQVVDASLQDVVDGKLGAPFVHPLVANADQSSGGVYIKVPMPYRESMRVYVENNPYFYHVTYRQFASAEGITRFDPADPAHDVVATFRAAGTKDPKAPFPESETHRSKLEIAPGKTATVAELTEPGALTELTVRLPQLQGMPTRDVRRAGSQEAKNPTPGKDRWLRKKAEPKPGKKAATTEEILRDTRIRISFDGEQTVDAPLGEFFGSGLGLVSVRSLMFGMDPETRTMSAWWLMPYAQTAKVELHNGSDAAITGGEATVTAARSTQWQADLASGDVGHFRATSVSEEATIGQDHTFIDTSGRGRVVGVTQTVQGLNENGARRNYLEGDERLFVDGSLSPDIHGTGTEDFYEGGWYFNRGAFSAPLNGAPVPDRADCPAGCTGMYRLLLAAGPQFGSSIRFGIEHGPSNNELALEESTTYWYGAAAEGEGSVHWTDSLDVGDDASETAHDYTSSAPGEVTELTGRFEGHDGPTEPVRLDARATTAEVSFRLEVAADNTGVVLRRTSDQKQGFQAAEVAVDGTPVGTWRQPLANQSRRWLDDSYSLPAATTAGKEAITVTLTPVEGQPAWSAAGYEALSVRPGYSDAAAPKQVTGGLAEAGEFTSIRLTWQPATDDVYAPSYQVYASTKQGFEPKKQNLVGTSEAPGLVHDPETPGQTWHYRVRAVDAAGNQGAMSKELTATTGAIVRLEAESLLPPVSTSAPVQVQGNCCNVVWSGDAQLWFTPEAAGHEVVVEFEVRRTGTYEVTARQTLARDYGINTLALDGQQIGERFDAYHSPEVQLSSPLAYGTHELKAGTHTLTLAVPDKNPESISYMAGLDYLQLRLAS